MFTATCMSGTAYGWRGVTRCTHDQPDALLPHELQISSFQPTRLLSNHYIASALSFTHYLPRLIFSWQQMMEGTEAGRGYMPAQAFGQSKLAQASSTSAASLVGGGRRYLLGHNMTEVVFVLASPESWSLVTPWRGGDKMFCSSTGVKTH